MRIKSGGTDSIGGASAPPSAADNALRHIMGQLRLTGRRRLKGFDYSGMETYHVAAVANFRRSLLVGEVASNVRQQILHSAARYDFEILSYVVMPDHVHILASGRSDSSDLIRFIQHFKQATGFAYKKAHGVNVWQMSSYDRVVRRDDDAQAMARYIVENPVRAGLVALMADWAYSGGTLVEEAAAMRTPTLSGAKAPPLPSNERAEHSS